MSTVDKLSSTNGDKNESIPNNYTSTAAETKQIFSGERINPFDKTTKPTVATTTTTTTSFSSEIGARKYSAPPSHPPPPLPKSVVPPMSTSPKSASSSRKSSESDRSLDDIIKDRFEKNQGVRDENTGRYSVPNEETIISSKKSSGYSTSSSIDQKSNSDYQAPATTTTSGIFDTKRFDYQNQKKFSTSGGSSDLDIIFGNNKPTSTGRSSTGGRYSVDQSSFSSISTESDIFEVTRSSGNSSSSYKGYAGSGIKNDVFQDYETPTSVNDKSAGDKFSTSSSSTITSSWKPTSNDDYDLK